MKSLLWLSCSLLSASIVFAQDEAVPHRLFPSPRHSGQGHVAFSASNVQLLGWKTLSDFPGANSSANDCWGYTSPAGREYALIGLSHGTGFVEVTDPGNPVIVDFETGNTSFWRCLKVYQHYAYAGSEGGGGIQVFDLSDIDSGDVQLVATVTSGSPILRTHTLALDEVSGFLYRAGSGSELLAYSLADPALPNYVGVWDEGYVHECHVVTWDVAGPYLGKQIAFCYMANTFQPLRIVDVTDKANMTLISAKEYFGSNYSHQGWLSADKTTLYLNDEKDDDIFGPSRTRLFDITNLAAPAYLGWFSSGAVSIDHNLYVGGNRIFESNYTSGLRVFDNTVPTAPTQIGFFDTYPESNAQVFNSLWSNYPFFSSGTILGSDVEKGLFVWRLGAPDLSFDFPGGVPELIGPSGGAIQFHVLEDLPGDLQSGTVAFHYSTGAAFTTVTPTHLGGDLYHAPLPVVPCGTALDFYVSARTSDDVTWTDPAAGPTQVHRVWSGYAESIAAEDDMEVDTGWSVNLAQDLGAFGAATTGTWTLVNPIGTSAQAESDHSDSPGTLAWVTDQGTVGGAVGEADVDDGATTLRSPILDASGLGDPQLSYWRWYSNYLNEWVDDVLVIDISNDGGASWVNLETLGPVDDDSIGGWVQHRVRIADFVAPTNTMRLRVIASDLSPASIVEAGLDDISIIDLECAPPPLTVQSIAPATGPFGGGNLVTITGTGFQPSTTVAFGPSAALELFFVSPTLIQARVPCASGPVSGKTGRPELRVDVTVETPGQATLPRAYTYTPGQRTF